MLSTSWVRPVHKHSHTRCLTYEHTYKYTSWVWVRSCIGHTYIMNETLHATHIGVRPGYVHHTYITYIHTYIHYVHTYIHAYSIHILGLWLLCLCTCVCLFDIYVVVCSTIHEYHFSTVLVPTKRLVAIVPYRYQ